MSAYQREEQNNTRLEELASKISTLRSVTNDIHAQSSDYSLIDSTVSGGDKKHEIRDEGKLQVWTGTASLALWRDSAHKTPPQKNDPCFLHCFT